jgi:hypothetical protein
VESDTDKGVAAEKRKSGHAYKIDKGSQEKLKNGFSRGYCSRDTG